VRIACDGGFEISAAAFTFVLCFLIAVSLVIAANLRIHSMCEEVNQRLPTNAQISVWDRSKMYELLRLHAEMYPGESEALADVDSRPDRIRFPDEGEIS
jgi:hypothetical protein